MSREVALCLQSWEYLVRCHRPVNANLAQEISRHSFVRCFYVALWCPNCGNLRAGLEKNPTTTSIPCPSCHSQAEVVRHLGEGRTSRNRTLPFWERVGN